MTAIRIFSTKNAWTFTTLLAASISLLAGCSLAVDDQPAQLRGACAKIVKESGDNAMTIKGKDNWLFLRNELRHLAAGNFWGEAAGKASRAERDDRKDPLPVILDVNRQLEDLGIELILVPVPPKAVVYPDKLPAEIVSGEGEIPRMDTCHQEFYKLLEEKGVKVVDLYPLFSDRKGPRSYCKSDTHWSGQACVEAAKLIASMIKDEGWYADLPKTDYETKSKEIEIKGDLTIDLPEGDPAASETLELRFVSKDGMPPEKDPHSPVLVMADSHGLVFSSGSDMHATGAGFVDQLACELRFPISVIAVRGSGATPTRIALYRAAQKDPEFLSSKKVLIWLFTAREFTETAGWAKLPITK